jgi:hypothetical protein
MKADTLAVTVMLSCVKSYADKALSVAPKWAYFSTQEQ